MITPILEKYLLNGYAKNKIHWFAFGMFSQIQIPADCYIVIHKIYWNGFFNQKAFDITNMSWKEFFAYNEYQLKIQSDKESPINYIFRNDVNFDWFFNGDPANTLKLMNAPINTAQYDDYILMRPKKPVIFDTFITAYDYLNFTLSRNSLKPSAVNFSIANQYANEQPPPVGINGQLILLDMTMTGSQGTQTTINPPGSKASSPPLVIQPNNAENYNQALDPEAAADYGSFIANPIGGVTLKHSEYVTNPLIGIEYCLIQKHTEGKLSPL